MAKSIILNKEFNKRKIFSKNFINRQVYHSFLKDSRLSLQERQHIYQKLTKIRYNLFQHVTVFSLNYHLRTLFLPSFLLFCVTYHVLVFQPYFLKNP